MGSGSGQEGDKWKTVAQTNGGQLKGKWKTNGTQVRSKQGRRGDKWRQVGEEWEKARGRQMRDNEETKLGHK